MYIKWYFASRRNVSLLLTLARELMAFLVSPSGASFDEDTINSWCLYASSGHFFRLGNGGSFIVPISVPQGDGREKYNRENRTISRHSQKTKIIIKLTQNTFLAIPRLLRNDQLQGHR